MNFGMSILDDNIEGLVGNTGRMQLRMNILNDKLNA